MHHGRELMECFAMKGWGDTQDQQVQKRISTNSWTWDPQSDTPGNKPVHLQQHCQCQKHRCREGEDDTAPSALCSALNLPPRRAKCSIPLNLQSASSTLHLIQALSIPNSVCLLWIFNILLHKIYRIRDFLTLKHLNFIFLNQRHSLKSTLCELTPVRKNGHQVWKQSTNLVLLDSLVSFSSQLTRETLQNRFIQKRMFSITNIP